MKTATLLVLLFGATVFAQEGVTRGDALKRREYQTYGAVTLFVDPTGNDTNACTASGTAACATVSGALAKLPLHIRHNVTINVAPGTYSGTVTFPPLQSVSTASISVQGAARTAPTIASGLTSGTLTSSNTNFGVVSGPAVFTDSTQTWTLDDLVGFFFEVTSGPLSGSVCPISGNTATTVSVACGFLSTAAPGDSYIIREPSSKFTGGWSLAGLSSSAIQFADLSITTSGTALQTFSNVINTSLVRVIVRSTTNTAVSALSRITTTGSSIIAAASTPALDVTQASAAPPLLSIQSTVIRNTGTGAAMRILRGAVEVSNFSLVVLRATPGPLTGGVLVTWGAGQIMPGSFPWPIVVQCDSPGSGTGFGVFSSQIESSATHAMSVHVRDCSFGVSLKGNNKLNVAASGFVSVGTAFQLTQGAAVDLASTTPTFSGVTTEFLLDGTPYTFGTLTALQAPQFIKSPQGSAIFR